MNLLESKKMNLLANFPPLLRDNFKTLCMSKLGPFPFCISQIIHRRQYTENNESYTYSYSLKIDYANQVLNWDLFFEPENIRFAPDFNFNDDSFTLSTELDCVVKYVPSLSTWDVNNPEALTLVLNEFRKLYKRQNKEKLYQTKVYAENPSVGRYFQLVFKHVKEAGMDIFVEDTTVHILVAIEVDLSGLPEYTQPPEMANWRRGDDNTSFLKCSLTIVVIGGKLSAVILADMTELRLPARLEQAMGQTPQIQFPNKHVVTEYVEGVKDELLELVKNTKRYYNCRKQYIMALFFMHPGHILEYDANRFSSIELLCEVDGYFCRVHIELGNEFEGKTLKMTLLSLYCVGPNEVCTRSITGFSLRSETAEGMVAETYAYLPQAIRSFKIHQH